PRRDLGEAAGFVAVVIHAAPAVRTKSAASCIAADVAGEPVPRAASMLGGDHPCREGSWHRLQGVLVAPAEVFEGELDGVLVHVAAVSARVQVVSLAPLWEHGPWPHERWSAAGIYLNDVFPQHASHPLCFPQVSLVSGQ